MNTMNNLSIINQKKIQAQNIHANKLCDSSKHTYLLNKNNRQAVLCQGFCFELKNNENTIPKILDESLTNNLQTLRTEEVDQFINSQPELLVRKGELLEDRKGCCKNCFCFLKPEGCSESNDPLCSCSNS